MLKCFHFAFPKYIQNPLSEKNVSHNLHKKENAPIITQWFYINNMSRASSAYDYKMRSLFCILKLLHPNLFVIARNQTPLTYFPKMTFSCFWECPRMLLATCALRDKPPLWFSSCGIFVISLVLPMTCQISITAWHSCPLPLTATAPNLIWGDFAPSVLLYSQDRQRPLLNSPKCQQSVNKAKLSQFMLNTIFTLDVLEGGNQK